MSHNIRIAVIAMVATVFTMASCKDTEPKEEISAETSTQGVTTPGVISYSIIKEYPHDAHAYTEGLEYIDGNIYESTGQYGHSDVRVWQLETGKILRQQKMDDRYFGEGITVLNGKIYQLTYKEKTGFVYDQKTLKVLQTFTYNNNEGWGMTNDGKSIIYSDGTDVLTFMDTATMKEVKRVNVKDQYGPIKNINELEYVKGYIYANIWQEDMLLKIDAGTGNVVARASFSAFRQQTGIPPSTNDDTVPEVMNGIAYDAKDNRFFITGKNWPKLYEVKLDN